MPQCFDQFTYELQNELLNSYELACVSIYRLSELDAAEPTLKCVSQAMTSIRNALECGITAVVATKKTDFYELPSYDDLKIELVNNWQFTIENSLSSFKEVTRGLTREQLNWLKNQLEPLANVEFYKLKILSDSRVTGKKYDSQIACCAVFSYIMQIFSDL